MARKPSNDTATFLMEYGVNLSNRTIYLSGEIDDAVSTKFMRGLELLRSASATEITVLITCPGGEVEAGFGIYDAICAMDIPVTTIAIGSAQSMAGLILQAGDTKIVSPNSTIMLHYSTVSSSSDGALAYEAWAKWSEVTRAAFIGILDHTTKRRKSYWRNKLKTDAIFTAHQAVELGLADKILTTFPYRSE